MANDIIPFASQGALAELPPGAYLMTYDRTDPVQQMALVRAVQGRDFGLDDCEGQEISVEHVVAHWAQWTDPNTGEMGDNVRTVLVAPDGTRYSTRSATVRTDVARLVQMLGIPAPFRPALRFVVRRQKNLSATRKYLQLEWLGYATPQGDG